MNAERKITYHNSYTAIDETPLISITIDRIKDPQKMSQYEEATEDFLARLNEITQSAD